MSVNIFKNGILSKIAGAVGDAVPLINNFLTNQAGKGAADANTVYVLNNKIEELNSSLNGLLNKETVIDTLISSGTETSWTNKTVKNLSQYKNIIFCLQRSSSEPLMFNPANIPYKLFKTMTSQSNFLTIATGNTNAYIYYVDDTTVSCKVGSGWAYCLYGVK